MENVANCLAELERVLAIRDRKPDALTHSFEQFVVAIQAKLNGLEVAFEQSFATGMAGYLRRVDVVIYDAANKIIAKVETKSGKDIYGVFDKGGLKELFADLKNAADEGIRQVWKLTQIEIGEKEKQYIQTKLEGVAAFLRSQLSKELSGQDLEIALKQAISQLHLVDKAGQVFKAEIQKDGSVILKPAMDVVFGASGLMTQAATDAASHSPNFKPAMEVLFGPSGKVTKEATASAGDVNLQPAFENLENNIEKGVTGALNAAGNKAVKISAAELIEKVGSGLNALGGAISAIPALHKSLKDLGEAWDKPLKTTDDYMNLLSAVGSTVSQFGSTLQAFAALTQVASAAQAVFNAIMAMNPVVLVVLAVIALIVVIALLIVYWDKVKAALRDNPWLAVIVAMTGVIGIIIVVIAYWDEIKLAVLKAANFISIQVQKIGYFFLGVGRLIGQIWDVVVASLANAGISILNGFITIGVGIQNFFIGIINWIIDQYNTLADSAIGKVAGLEKAAKLPEVDLETKLIPPKEVPTIDVDAAFKTPEIKGGLEEQIAKQEEAVKKAQDADDKRRKEKAAKEAQPAPGAPGVPGVPGAPGVPAVPGAPSVPGLPAVPPALAPGAVTPPPVPEGPLPAPAAAAAAGPTNVTVNLGGVTVNVNADKLEANAAQMLSDEIVNALASRLGSLLAEQNFRTGTRPA
jgi:hypothetical protein